MLWSELMASRACPDTNAALQAAAREFDFVLVPGRYDSGPEHWQSCWERCLPLWQRITLQNWQDPDIDRWVGAVNRLRARSRKRAILVGHSLGALASCCLAATPSARVAAVMLVAPAEPVKFEVEDRVPGHALGVPSLLVASRNDPFMSYRRAEHWAGVWGSDLIDLGEAGHINVEAGFGPWTYGLELLLALSMRAGQAGR